MLSNDQIKRVSAACHSQLAAPALSWATITASYPAVIKTLHGHHRDQQQAERGDDLPAHRFGDHRALAVNAELEHGAGQSLDHGARRNAERSGDFLRGHALCHGKKKLQFPRRKASAEVAFPCTVYDCRFHDVYPVVFPLHPASQVQK